MARAPLTPSKDETLGAFLRRAQEARGLKSAEALALHLQQLRAKKGQHPWIREVKSWRSKNGVQSIQSENAELLERALDADFSRFVRTYPNRLEEERAWRSEIRGALAELLEEIRVLRRRLEG